MTGVQTCALPILIQAGVKEVVYPSDVDVPERWQADFDISTGMLNEAGIEVRQA